MKCALLNTPVLLLVFNRPDTTREVFEAIKKARPAKLYVAADAPRQNHLTDLKRSQQTLEIIKDVDWDCEIHTLFRNTNLGCKNAIGSAIDWFFEHETEGIILEDDCLPSPSFFTYCAELLERYRHDTRIMMISGTNEQQHPKKICSDSYYFTKHMHIWGWATWKRAWDLHDRQMSTLPNYIESGTYKNLFTDLNICLYWAKTWIQTYIGIINTWDHAWVYTCLINNGLAIAPAKNLISNIGFGKDSTHTQNTESENANRPRHNLTNLQHPTFTIANNHADLLEYQAMRIYPEKPKKSLKYIIKRIRRANKYKKVIANTLETGLSSSTSS